MAIIPVVETWLIFTEHCGIWVLKISPQNEVQIFPIGSASTPSGLSLLLPRYSLDAQLAEQWGWSEVAGGQCQWTGMYQWKGISEYQKFSLFIWGQTWLEKVLAGQDFISWKEANSWQLSKQIRDCLQGHKIQRCGNCVLWNKNLRAWVRDF